MYVAIQTTSSLRFGTHDWHCVDPLRRCVAHSVHLRRLHSTSRHPSLTWPRSYRAFTRSSLSGSTLSLPPQRRRLFGMSESNVATLAWFPTQSSNRPRKPKRRRPVCFGTKTSPLSALDVSIASIFYLSHISLAKKPTNATTLHSTIKNCDVDFRKICTHVVLSGGMIVEHMTSELTTLAPSTMSPRRLHRFGMSFLSRCSQTETSSLSALFVSIAPMCFFSLVCMPCHQVARLCSMLFFFFIATALTLSFHQPVPLSCLPGLGTRREDGHRAGGRAHGQCRQVD